MVFKETQCSCCPHPLGMRYRVEAWCMCSELSYERWLRAECLEEAVNSDVEWGQPCGQTGEQPEPFT